MIIVNVKFNQFVREWRWQGGYSGKKSLPEQRLLCPEEFLLSNVLQAQKRDWQEEAKGTPDAFQKWRPLHIYQTVENSRATEHFGSIQWLDFLTYKSLRDDLLWLCSFTQELGGVRNKSKEVSSAGIPSRAESGGGIEREGWGEQVATQRHWGLYLASLNEKIWPSQTKLKQRRRWQLSDGVKGIW